MKKTPKEKGAVLLIAILVASVALAVGLGVYNRTYKELLFSEYWQQTQRAFSAADSGLECAMYWIKNPGAGGVGSASCFGMAVPGWDPKVQTGSFTINLIPVSGPCVYVVTGWDAALLATTTVARGYNDACGSTNPRRVERGLKASI